MRRGVIYKLMIAFVALVIVGLLPFKAFADMTIVISSQPGDYSGPVGGVATFSVEAEGDDLTYQWQAYSSGSWKASSLPGAKTNTLSVDVTSSRNGYQYRCEIKDSHSNTVYSDTATIYIIQPITITTHPSDYSGEVGSEATFTVAATGDGLTYQWQAYTNGSWKNSSLPGYNTATLTVAVTASRNGYKFRCVVKDANGNSATSNDATLSIAASDAITITTQPSDYSGPLGSVAEFTVAAQGEDLKYQWQAYTNGSWKNSSLPGYKTSTLSVDVTNSRNGYKFRCVITDASGNTKTSGEATLTVAAPDTILIALQPEDCEATVGSVAEFIVGAEGDGLTYQWQVNTSGTWKNSTLPGYKTNKLSVDAFTSRNGYKFRCVITDASGNTKTSDEATLTVVVKSTFTVTLNAGDGVFANGSSTMNIEEEPGYILLNKYEIPQLDGYDFRGWLDKDGKSVNNVDITADVTYYADYRKINIVTLNANGGVFDDDLEIHTKGITGSYYYLDELDNPYREGYRFTGWLYNGQLVYRRIALNQDIELTAQWVEVVYITYNANGGSWGDGDGETDAIVEEQIKGVYYNIGIEDPVREGYRFAGWMVDGQWASGKVKLTESFTIEAVWEQTVEVSYNPNGGGWGIYDYDNEEYVFETTPRVRTENSGSYRVGEWWPEREGYDFIGWSTNSLATTAQTDYTTILEGDTVFYAIWKKQGTIHYVANGGYWGWREDPDQNWEEERVDYVSDGEFYYIDQQAPWHPENAYEFRGWYDKAGNRLDDEEITVASTTDLYVYALWSHRINITYNGNGGVWEYDSYDENDQFIGHFVDTTRPQWGDCWSGDYFTPNCDWEPQFEGHEFLGWTAVKDGAIIEGDYLLPDDDIVFYAKWLPYYKVTYVANGGEYSDYDEQHGESATGFYRYAKPGEEYYPEYYTPDRNGYRFIGWTTVKDDYTTLINDPFVLEGDITIYAYWYQPKTVTYITSIGAWNEYDSLTGENTPLTQIERETNNNGDYNIDDWTPWIEDWQYEFLGYSLTEGSTVADYRPGEHIDFVPEDMTLFAVWQKVPVITYDAGEGQFGPDENTIIQTGRPGRKYYVRCPNPERDGYDFVGWADSQGKIVTDTVITLKAGDELVFTAVWVERTNCTVTFNPNGGFFPSDDTLEYKVDEFDYDSWVRLGCEWPEREGYEFMGWSTDRNATIGKFDWDERIVSNVTYYAIWAKNTTITLNAGDGLLWVWHDEVWDFDQNPPVKVEDGYNSWEHTDEIVVVEGSEIPVYLIPTPELDGYWFEGWMDSNGNIVNTITAGDEDITLTAKWTKIYTVTFLVGENDEYEVWECEAGEYLQTNWVPEPYKENLVFAGWSLDGEYVTNYMLTDKDVTFEAIWVPLN